MTVPEATMHQDDRLPFGQYHVWLAGQVFPVQPEAIAQPVQRPPHLYLWQRIRRADPAHDRGPALT
jgi:hypothetical protein